MIVDGQKHHMTGQCFKTLQGLYMAEGIAGLYRGFVPRALHVFPLLMAGNYAADRIGSNDDVYNKLSGRRNQQL